MHSLHGNGPGGKKGQGKGEKGKASNPAAASNASNIFAAPDRTTTHFPEIDSLDLAAEV